MIENEPLKEGVRFQKIKRFGFTKIKWFRRCSRCLNEWEVDEGRCCYDEWICSECSRRMGF